MSVELVLLGAGGIGLVWGWWLAPFAESRQARTWLAGAAILAIFPAGSALFGAYGIGLAVGFFLYFAFLLGFVARSTNFTVDWFLDGRRKRLADDEITTDGQKPMAAPDVKVR